MLRNIFGGKEDIDKSIKMTSATSITSAEFKDALNRYPALIKKFSTSGMSYFIHLLLIQIEMS